MPKDITVIFEQLEFSLQADSAKLGSHDEFFGQGMLRVVTGVERDVCTDGMSRNPRRELLSAKFLRTRQFRVLRGNWDMHAWTLRP